nr:T9SS type A sorting domain-containing protein [Pseudoflavitalea sp. G-6-1-2]
MNGYNILVYPNPARNTIKVKGLAGNETIQVSDVTGRLLKQVKSSLQQESIGISDLPEGIYHIVIMAADGHSSSYKITKLR